MAPGYRNCTVAVRLLPVLIQEEFCGENFSKYGNLFANMSKFKKYLDDLIEHKGTEMELIEKGIVNLSDIPNIRKSQDLVVGDTDLYRNFTISQT